MTVTATMDHVVQLMPEGCTVMVASTKGWHFAHKEGEILAFEHGLDDAKLAATFELRAFDGTSEWRWIRRGASGVLATISDESMSEIGASVLRFEQPLRYICWGTVPSSGEVGGANAGWSALHDGAVDDLCVPLAGGAKGDIAVLDLVEYTQEDEFGNHRVIDQRLVSLTWLRTDGTTEMRSTDA